jgi:hypothetical protein
MIGCILCMKAPRFSMTACMLCMKASRFSMIACMFSMNAPGVYQEAPGFTPTAREAC